MPAQNARLQEIELKRPSDIVGAVPVRRIRGPAHRMLEDAGAVGYLIEMDSDGRWQACRQEGFARRALTH